MQRFRMFLKHHGRALFVLYGIWGTYWVALLARAVSVRPDGVYLASTNSWSDWALHIALTNRFAYLAPRYWFASHPYYAGGHMNYPFVTDFISGMLMRLGLPLAPAMIVPSIITALTLLLVAYLVFYRLFASRTGAVIAISLFFLSAGFGFLHFLSDTSGSSFLSALANPLKEYSRFDAYQWYSGNVIVGMLFPQRTFLLGMTLALTALYLLLCETGKKTLSSQSLLVTAGALVGILVIVHPHSFIAMGVLSFFLLLPFWRQWRMVLWYAIPALGIGALLYASFIADGNRAAGGFMHWMPGWTMDSWRAWVNQWLFWQWGAMLTLALVTFVSFYKEFSRNAKMVTFGALVLFALANLVTFQPIPWDNSKIFTWVYFVLAGVVSVLLIELVKLKGVFTYIAAIFFILLTGTGILELTRLQRVDLYALQETPTEEVVLGEQVRASTDPLAVFVTSNSHNNFITVWAARSIFLGFTPWVENFGFPSTPRYYDTIAIYRGGTSAEEALRRNRVSYVVIGPAEVYDFQPNIAYFESSFPVAFKDETHRIYDVRRLWDVQVSQ